MNKNKPTVTELVSAVRKFLISLSEKELEGREAYFARVSANILDVVEREIVQGHQLDVDEQKRLERLLDRRGSLSDLNAELCQKIKERKIDTGDEKLIDHLRLTVMGKLSIDNPNYATYKKFIDVHGKQYGKERKQK